MSAVINVQDANTHFSRLLERAHAGEEIVLAKAGKPYARLMPLAAARPQRRPGSRLPAPGRWLQSSAWASYPGLLHICAPTGRSCCWPTGSCRWTSPPTTP